MKLLETFKIALLSALILAAKLLTWA